MGLPKILPCPFCGATDVTEKGKQMSEWISVKDRLPKVNGRYIVFNEITAPEDLGGNHTEIRIMRYHEETWYTPNRYPACINEAIKDNITYWMPLPEEPKEKDDDSP